MKVLHVTCRIPFGHGEFQKDDIYIVARNVVSVQPSDVGCVITCVSNETFDTANDPIAILAQLEAAE